MKKKKSTRKNTKKPCPHDILEIVHIFGCVECGKLIPIVDLMKER